MDAFLSSIEDAHAQKVFTEDARLLVCKACGVQYDVEGAHELKPKANECPICQDPRQAVPASGQAFTSILEWCTDKDAAQRKASIVVDRDAQDERILRIEWARPAAGIGGQTPIILRTLHGLVIWDCCATCTPEMFAQVKALAATHQTSVLAIAISHPHFYTTALTWAKALQCKVYVSSVDAKDWWMRKHDDKAVQQHCVFYDEQVYEIRPGITLVRCGGHFDGSAALLWDRGVAGAPVSSGTIAPTSSVLLPSDTFMPAANHATFAFMWSYPNMLPLAPKAIVGIWHALKPFAFEDVIGSWLRQYVMGNGRQRVLDSAKLFIRHAGHDPDTFDW